MEDNIELPQYRLKLEYEDRCNNSSTAVEKNFDEYGTLGQFGCLIQEIACSLQAMGFGTELIKRYMEVDL